MVRLTYQKYVVFVMIELKLVKYIPEKLEENVLYVSMEFETAIHLCGCGCGTEICTPINDKAWVLHKNDDLFSLTPSIGGTPPSTSIAKVTKRVESVCNAR